MNTPGGAASLNELTLGDLFDGKQIRTNAYQLLAQWQVNFEARICALLLFRLRVYENQGDFLNIN
jgi:hypothetical protein